MAVSGEEMEKDYRGTGNVNNNNGGSNVEDNLKVVITGGCGFLGQHLARSVYETFPNARIILMDFRPVDGVENFISRNNNLNVRVETIGVDVTDLTNLKAQFINANPDVVFHCAGITEMGATIQDKRLMSIVNVDGTRNVIRACEECGVRVLVYAGSLAQILRANRYNQEGINENTRLQQGEELVISRYGATKNNAERLVLRAPLYTCSLRCPPLYGEHDNTFIPSAAWAAQRFFGYYPNCGKPNKRMTAMYVGNAAWAHVCAAKCLLDSSTRDAINGQFFYISDDTPSENYTSFFMRFLRPRYGTTFRLPVIILTVMLYLIVVVVVFFSSVFQLQIPSPVLNYRRQIKVLSISHTVSWDKARDKLDYRPKYQFSDAVNRSRIWYNAHI